MLTNTTPTNRQINAAETARANTFAREVAQAILKLRNWNVVVPREVRDDVFATIARHDRLYSRAFDAHQSPQMAAQAIQNAEWDR